MFFISFEFLLFLPIVCALYFLTPFRFRWILLLISSYFFYSYWNPFYLIIILFSTIVDYLVGITIENKTDNNDKRKWLFLSVALNFGLLCFFKYFNFLSGEIAHVFSSFGVQFDIPKHQYLLPLGISFYTFQTLSYSIDVYRGKIKAERHFGKYALYVSFFPQLVAGPIERAKNLLQQFNFEYKFEYKRVVEGLQLLLWGLFEKLIIADRLGLYVNEVFDNPGDHTGLTIWVASVFFMIQIFCDFSGYSHIAIGIARILGVNLSRNFGNTPYFTIYISSMFRSWHITLTNWMKDYVFFPLVRKYRSEKVRGLLVFFVFLLIGFWHGANWTFVFWGGIVGLFIAIEYYTDGWKASFFSRLGKFQTQIAKVILIFFNLLLLSFACLFFRSSSLSVAWNFIKDSLVWSSEIIVIDSLEFYLALFFWGLMEAYHFMMKKEMIHQFLRHKQTLFRWSFYIIIINSILFLRVADQPEFIYFDF